MKNVKNGIIFFLQGWHGIRIILNKRDQLKIFVPTHHCEEKKQNDSPASARHCEERKQNYSPVPTRHCEKRKQFYFPAPARHCEERKQFYFPAPARHCEERKQNYSPVPTRHCEETKSTKQSRKGVAFFKKILLPLIIFFSLPSFADENARIQLTQYLQAMTTYSAQFKQTVYDKQNTVTQVFTGEMAWQKPNLFRWNILSNPKQVVILKKETLWIYDPDLEQLTIRAWRQIEDQVAPVLLLNAPTKTLMHYFNVIKASKRDEMDMFNLIPKKSDALFNLIQLGFKQGKLSVMILHDALAGVTKIEFSHIQFNQPLASQVFILKYPATVDIVDERKKKSS